MKKNICLILLIILLSFSGNVFSQNIIVKGKISPSAISHQPSALIRLLTYNDMLTYEQTTIYETVSDENGNFNIEADIDDIVMAQIAVDLERVDILLKPNSSYEVEIIIPEQKGNVSYFERQTPTLKMIKADDDNLYYQYHSSNVIIDDFVYDNFNNLYRNRQTSLLNSLDVTIEKQLGEIGSGFVKDNIRYRKAAIQMMTGNTNKIINQYFNKQEILYSSPAYMNLFNEVFADYLASRQFSHYELRDLLYSDYDSFLKYIKGKDVFLSDNDNLSELIVAWNLMRMYYEMPDEKNKIHGYLYHIIQNTKHQKNKEVVSDILKSIDRLSFDSEAPQFSLKDSDGDLNKLSDFKDGIILLQFANQVSPMTGHHFEMLKELSSQWRDNVKIITIATKDSYDDFRQMFEGKGYNWTLLNLGNDILLLEKYQIRTFPDYVIIGKDNKIGMAPAPSPDQQLDYHVLRIYNYYKK